MSEFVFTTSDITINLKEKKLEVKQTLKMGLGLFASEKIEAGTIFLRCEDIELPNNEKTHISKYINDLAFDGNNLDYYDKSLINVGYLKHNYCKLCLCGFVMPHMYLIALRDIEKGEELSKYYGIDYWKNICFIKNMVRQAKYYLLNICLLIQLGLV